MSIKSPFQQHRWRQRASLALCALALLASIGFGLRAYVSLQLMRAAYAVGGDLEAATRFLQNLAGASISFALLMGAWLALRKERIVVPLE
jgi:hypothetical protein